MTPDPKIPIFVSTWPDAEGALPAWLGMLEESGFLVLHPNFAWKNETGRKIAEEIGNLAGLDGISDEMLSRDFFSMRCSQIHVFDIDHSPGEHFLALSFALGLPCVGISNHLQGVSPYFSISMDCILKPNDILEYLAKFKKPD